MEKSEVLIINSQSGVNDNSTKQKISGQGLIENETDMFTAEYFKDLRPDDLNKAIIKARENGLNVAEDIELQAGIKHLFSEFKKREARYSPSTLLRLESAWGSFLKWCQDNGHYSLPAEADTVERFFIHKGDESHRNTLSIYKWAISRVHRIGGCPDPTKDVYVEDRIKAISREKVQSGEQIKQATPFNEQHLNRLITPWIKHDRVLIRRNLCLLAVAYESMLREAEIANIKLSDICLTDDGSAILTIPITKTNHSGESDTCILSYDVVELIFDYLEKGNMKITDEGYLFAGVSKHNKCTKNLKPISTKTVEGIFKLAWVELKLERQGGRPFTGHSARVGATQDLLKKGYNTLQIQQSGRWASEAMVVRYGRGILAKEGAMAKSRLKPRD